MNTNWRRATYASLAVGAAAATLSVLPWLLALDQSIGLAWLFGLRGMRTPPDSVAVVVLSAESAAALGQGTDLDEWPRDLHARVVERLHSAGATAIAMDVSFEQEGEGASDAELAGAIEAAGNVVLLARVAGTQWGLADGSPVADERSRQAYDLRTRLVPSIERAALATAPFTLPRVPFRVDQFWVFGGPGSDVGHLPFVALQVHLLGRYESFVELLERHRPALAERLPATRAALADGDLELVIKDIRRAFLADSTLGDELIEDVESRFARADAADLAALIDAYSGEASRFIDFYGTSGTLETVPYHRIFEMSEAALRDAVAGRAVFVGYAEGQSPEQQEDEFVTVYSETTGISLSGVEIGATAFANLLSRSSIMPLSIPVQWLWVAAWGAGLMLALSPLRVRAAVILGIGAGLAYWAGAAYAFGSAQSWWPMVVPICVQVPLAVAAHVYFRFADLNVQRGRIQAALGRYVPARVVERLADDTFEPHADRELLHGTCLISDVEQYTRVAEAMAPDELAELMHRYFATLSERVEKSGGYVADLSGDSMVAIWAAARPDAELRRNACESALGLLADVTRFNRDAVRALPTGVGLDSGQVLLGDIGAGDRHRFRAVGDIVNTASRIQGLNRKLGTRALASASTLAGLAGPETRYLGEFLLVGKRSSVELYELLDGEASRELGQAALDAFAAGMRSFAERDWERGRALFERVLAARPADGPSRFYVEQCRLHAGRELPRDWRGTIRMTAK